MKHLKMLLYGQPGVGKSVFASKSRKPFFITTDGNYEFLEDFGAKEKDHIQINSWVEYKRFIQSATFEGYDTIVVDLLEDLFKLAESDYCRVNGWQHISDAGFAKGYDMSRNGFFIDLCKILNREDKDIILLSHETTGTKKDRRNIEHSVFYPSSRLPDKVLDMIEGRMRFVLRCYVKAEEDENGKLHKKRYLSLIPKENEYGIVRGIDESSVPSDIPLDFATFAQCIGLDSYKKTDEKKAEASKAAPKVADVNATKIDLMKPKAYEEVKPQPTEAPKVTPTVKIEEAPKEPEQTDVAPEVAPTAEKATEPAKTDVEDSEAKKAKMLAELKAKMLAMKNRK